MKKFGKKSTNVGVSKALLFSKLVLAFLKECRKLRVMKCDLWYKVSFYVKYLPKNKLKFDEIYVREEKMSSDRKKEPVKLNLYRVWRYASYPSSILTFAINVIEAEDRVNKAYGHACSEVELIKLKKGLIFEEVKR